MSTVLVCFGGPCDGEKYELSPGMRERLIPIPLAPRLSANPEDLTYDIDKRLCHVYCVHAAVGIPPRLVYVGQEWR